MVFSESPEPQTLPTNCFAAKILCKAHNEFLSPLDAALKRFFEAADGIVRAAVLKPAARPNLLFLQNGNDVEYALLKMMCGLTASGAVRGVSSGKFDTRWPRILLGHEPWPTGWGLYAAQNRPEIHSGGLEMLAD